MSQCKANQLAFDLASAANQRVEKSILFSGPMVRAILAGTKTETRRVLKPQPQTFSFWDDGTTRESEVALWLDDDNMRLRVRVGRVITTQMVRWAPDDRFWVRETFSGPWSAREAAQSPKSWSIETPIWYWADGNPEDGDWTKPKPSIHMPRWASRITLLVKAVGVERLHDITPAGALAEGIAACQTSDPRDEFAALWRTINGPGSWEANPWVAVVQFERVTQ
jgi:hypothetical protein